MNNSRGKYGSKTTVPIVERKESNQMKISRLDAAIFLEVLTNDLGQLYRDTRTLQEIILEHSETEIESHVLYAEKILQESELMFFQLSRILDRVLDEKDWLQNLEYHSIRD